MIQQDFKPVSYSETTVSELMIPAYANFGGKIHGGILLSLMDKVAYACASKHAGNYCVTVSVDNVDFLEPVDVGDMLTMFARIHYVGKTSMVVGIKVIAENFKSGTVKHTNTSYFTMVAKENGLPVPVPGVVLETRDDINRFLEAKKRKEIKASYKEELRSARASLLENEELSLLKNERCVIKE